MPGPFPFHVCLGAATLELNTRGKSVHPPPYPRTISQEQVPGGFCLPVTKKSLDFTFLEETENNLIQF